MTHYRLSVAGINLLCPYHIVAHLISSSHPTPLCSPSPISHLPPVHPSSSFSFLHIPFPSLPLSLHYLNSFYHSHAFKVFLFLTTSLASIFDPLDQWPNPFPTMRLIADNWEAASRGQKKKKRKLHILAVLSQVGNQVITLFTRFLPQVLIFSPIYNRLQTLVEKDIKRSSADLRYQWNGGQTNRHEWNQHLEISDQCTKDWKNRVISGDWKTINREKYPIAKWQAPIAGQVEKLVIPWRLSIWPVQVTCWGLPLPLEHTQWGSGTHRASTPLLFP